jgi:ABC-type lipoprotein release transport system permease subunit
MGNKKFRIIGTFSLGSPELDGMSCFINIEAADELLTMNGKVNVIALKLNEIKTIPEFIENFNRINKDTLIVALGWEQVLPELKQSIELDDASNLIFLFLLIIVVAFGILNTMLMSITERYREFGIMLALGTNNTRLLVIVFFEVVFLITIGIVLGNLSAHAVNYYYYHNPILLSGSFAEIYEQYGFIPALYFSIDLGFYLDISLKIMLISFATFVFPAIKIFRLRPLKGIRYT